MGGIYPDIGVTPADAVNGFDATTTGAVSERFYPTNTACPPRLDPAATNALISEILNVMECAGHSYDGTALDNLCRAIQRMICVPDAAVGLEILQGCFVISADGLLSINNSGAAITIAGPDLTQAGLIAEGFTPVDTETDVSGLNIQVTPAGALQITTTEDGTTLTDNVPMTVIAAALLSQDANNPLVTGGDDLLIVRNASETQNGVVEMATQNNLRDGDAVDLTGAPLAFTPAQLHNLPLQTQPLEDGVDFVYILDNSTNQLRRTEIVEVQNLGGVTIGYMIDVI